MRNGNSSWQRSTRRAGTSAALRIALALAAALSTVSWCGSTFAGQTTLSATLPTTNVDGTKLENLSSLRAYWRCGAGSGYPLQETWPAPLTGSDTVHDVLGLPDGTTCFFVLTALTTDGAESMFSNEASKVMPPPDPPGKAGLVVATQPDPPPTVFQSSADVGGPALAGSSAIASGIYTLKAGGSDIWGTADQFRFTYTTLTGDGEIVARVSSLTNADVWTKAGVMIRDTLQPGSPYVLMMVSSMRGVDLQWRAAANQNAQQALSDMTTRAPRWLRLTRSGNVFRGYHSADGVTWTLYSTQTVPLQANALVGLAVTSHNVAVLATGVFDGVRVID
jgi:regulation of enolase protein 1 (concanavalin A-like superfamily)